MELYYVLKGQLNIIKWGTVLLMNFLEKYLRTHCLVWSNGEDKAKNHFKTD